MIAEAARLHQAGHLDQAALLYRKILAIEPGNADGLHLLGFLAYQRGRADDAVDLIRKAIAINGRNASFHFHLALALKTLGNLDQAVASYRRALVLKPNDADTYNNLGNALAAAGKLDEAVSAFRRALSIAPNDARALNNLGSALSGQGHQAEAEAHYRKAIALAPDYADAHDNLGLTLWDMGKRDEAVMLYRRALALDPNHVGALGNLALALWESGALDEAEAAYRRILVLRPDDPDLLNDYAALLLARGQAGAAMALIRHSLAIKQTRRAKKLFVDLASQSGWTSGNDEIRAVLVRALSEPWDRPARLAQASANLIKLDPALGPLVARANATWPRRLPSEALLGAAGLAPLADDAPLIALLIATPNTDIALERFLTMVRGTVLAAAAINNGGGGGDDRSHVFCGALARQCFINEYVFLPTEEERAAAEKLRAFLAAALEAGNPVSVPHLLAVAAYFPLHEIPAAARLLEREWPEPVLAVLIQQIREPLEEIRLCAEIPRLTEIEDEVSRLVQNQYEENPYPRWVRIAPGGPDTIATFLARKFPLADFERGRKMKDVLVAGCGTGQHSISTAQKFGDAGMLAVDLSLASLSYAKRKSQELGLAIEYGQADILALGALGREFDLIECVGVLHHMADPCAGWAALLTLLRPGGFMWLGFYSESARRNIARTRARIAEQRIGAGADDIRRFRQEMVDSKEAPAFASILNSEDFFSISACRDLLFHAQEHGMSLGGINEFLKGNNLTFMGFDLHDAVLHAYRQRFPEDKPATDLSKWEIFESENPDMFAAMYVFWIQKPAR
jgi:Flp pilus assembly protein TadD/2-polyprenyl-3-methyl-5-hydroxy-6-metoxy-1,4-benzoquinol methylase